MRFLADTHAVLWYLLGKRALPDRVRDAFDDGANEVFVSAASAWEITTKHRLGKLPEADFIAAAVEHHLSGHGFQPLPITMAHAEMAGRLAGTHRDPFDRMLIAQALSENLTLVSNEAAFDAFGVSRLW
ncbi:type II toxin-antitoxin system VapC family toxin [Enterovirga rhinocerotis]|uniref:PIN domain nuclease of toxin-antitoxin system n=1 Tax=Enterovirga rhinocerotis TaxID=1339210 RepID=A0A4R7C7K2_9HYPH|nr:type II toxin-antitoxin system VapC family toxin [Enterovirga rhinocerotis]TDR94614.1 PIN domain nuclease of toxin-antitoxin system [Enterovirga rhinocerotis]